MILKGALVYGQVLFPGRSFRVRGGIVCCGRWATEEMKWRLLQACGQALGP